MSASKWEYLFEKMCPRMEPSQLRRFDDLGAEGWELVAVTFNPNSSMYGELIAYFKRPVVTK